MKNKKIIIIAGPTAVGKTALSVSLAKRINGEIISADSMQIYKQMDIGTAKVTASESSGITHHMIDIVSPQLEKKLKESGLKEALVCLPELSDPKMNYSILESIIQIRKGEGLRVKEDDIIKLVEELKFKHRAAAKQLLVA